MEKTKSQTESQTKAVETPKTNTTPTLEDLTKSLEERLEELIDTNKDSIKELLIRGKHVQGKGFQLRIFLVSK